MSIKKLTLSSLSGLLAKVVSVLVMITLVPMAKSSLAPGAFGLWMLFTSLLMILQFSDFGIGNGLVNIISSRTSGSGKSQLLRAVSTAIVLLVSISVILFLFMLAVTIGVDNWDSMFKVTDVDDSSIRSALIIFGLFLTASIPVAVGQKILWGFQEVHIANLWQIISSVLTLFLFIVFVWLGAGLEWIVAVSVIGPFLAMTACSFDQLMRRRKHLMFKVSAVSRKMATRLLRQGGGWTIYQTLFFMATSADGVFVTHLFGAEAMGTYGLMIRMVSGLSVALFFTVPLWPIFANAVANNDEVIIRRYFKLAIITCSSIGAIAGIALFLFAQPVAHIWAGSDVIPPMSLVLPFSLWIFIYNLWAGISSLMSNELMIKRMVMIAGCGCLIAIGLKYPMATQIGPEGICWASVIGIGFSSVAGLYILSRHVYKK